jgi:hypothetical protein
MAARCSARKYCLELMTMVAQVNLALFKGPDSAGVWPPDLSDDVGSQGTGKLSIVVD